MVPAPGIALTPLEVRYLAAVVYGENGDENAHEFVGEVEPPRRLIADELIVVWRAPDRSLVVRSTGRGREWFDSVFDPPPNRQRRHSDTRELKKAGHGR